MSDLIGVIWSLAITRDSNAGYALVIRSDQIVGVNKGAWGFSSGSLVYFGPGSRATESDKERAQEVATKLLERPDFELSKSDITKITYRAPGLFSKGHVVIASNKDDIELNLARLTPDIGVRQVIKSLLPSLVYFANDKLYDEKTGKLLGNEIMKTHRLPK